MVTIVQCRDRATIKLTNDPTYEEVQVMFQDKDEADEMLYRLLRSVISKEE